MVSSVLAQSGDTAQADPYSVYEQMAQALVLVETQYVSLAPRQKLVEGALRGMVSELDPHSSYLTPKEYAEFRSDTEGQFAGIGVEVDYRDEVVTVLAPMEGSPAERAGLRAGDVIVTIDGSPLQGERFDRVIARMRGAPGTKVRVGVRRTGASELLSIDIVREVIRVKSVVAKRLAGDVAYLRIRQFQDGTHDELLAAVAKLRADSSTPLAGLVLDLRNDPGGLVNEAEAIADELLSDGVIYSTRHRGRVVEEVRAQPGGALAKLPAVALVNEYSASAAELVAGALQDNGRAKVVGAQTFGKGSVQTIYELEGGAGMRLTTMRYYTPKGRSLQALGIRPDVRVDLVKAPQVVRESDLTGHLAAEAESQAREPQVVVTEPKPAEGAAPSEPGPARDIPTDPLKGSDFALSVAYRVLLGRPLR